jgi:site-specific recombinase XerD
MKWPQMTADDDFDWDGHPEGDENHLSSALARLPETLTLPDAPVGGDARAVRIWFDETVDAIEPVMDGTLAAERDAAKVFQRMAKAENTRIAYRAAVRAWCAWCELRGLAPLPASGADVATFLAAERRRGLAPNTIDLRRAAIRYLHRAAGCAVPTGDVCVADTVAGIRRDAARKGEAPEKKAAATASIVRQMLAQIPDDLRGLRDKALILVAFAGALRRSELVAIRVERLEQTERGLRLTIPQSKGSQAAAVIVPLPYGETELCPVRALARWREAAGITSGPVFRRIWLAKQVKAGEAGGLPAGGPPPALPRIGHDAMSTRAIADMVQARASAAGFDGKHFGGHSLKRGALTTGMERGVHPADLKRLGRHKSFDVLGEYLEFGDLFDRHALKGVL